jgi:hypothetical protein
MGWLRRRLDAKQVGSSGAASRGVPELVFLLPRAVCARAVLRFSLHASLLKSAQSIRACVLRTGEAGGGFPDGNIQPRHPQRRARRWAWLVPAALGAGGAAVLFLDLALLE